MSRWLQNQVIEAPMDHKATHIRRLFAWVREFTSQIPNRAHDSIAVCFCGPSSMVHMIGSAAADIHAEMEFAAEQQ